MFRARWLFFDAGMIEASASEIAPCGGSTCVTFALHTWTTNAIASIFRMDDHFESLWDVEKRLPKKLVTHVRETHTVRDKEMEFDHSAKSVVVSVNKDVPKKFDLNPLAQDFFSASYFTRSLKLEPKNTVLVPVFEDNKNYDAAIQVIKKERLPVLDGKVDTVMLMAKLRFEGAFQNSRSLYIWLSDDEYHIPVRLEISLLFGAITLDLVEATGVDLRIIRENPKP
jgi:hypothetical protein